MQFIDWITGGGEKQKPQQQQQQQRPQQQTQGGSDSQKHAVQLFSFSGSKWNPVQYSNCQTNTVLNELTVVTYNIWFEKHYFSERLNALLSIFEANSPTVICLQEVTPSSLNHILSSPFIQQNYHATSSPSQQSLVVPYGMLTLVSKQVSVKDTYLWSFTSGMCRYLLVAEVEFYAAVHDAQQGKAVAAKQHFVAANTHLESLDSAKIREAQMKVTAEKLKPFTNAMFMGDFNFCFEKNFHPERKPLENDVMKGLFSDYMELWSHLRPNEKGYTFDSEVNKMLRHYEQMRYDRMLLKCHSSWKPKSIQILGDKAFLKTEQGSVVFPSDHFGLVSKVQFG